MASSLVGAHPRLPLDCRSIIAEFLPQTVLERCHVCGFALVMLDRRGRVHLDPHIVCTESIALCCECYEQLYQ